MCTLSCLVIGLGLATLHTDGLVHRRLRFAETWDGVAYYEEWYEKKPLKTLTPMLYIRTDEGWTAGLGSNSFGNASVFAGKAWSHKLEQGGDVSLLLGGITGYRKTAVSPLVSPSYGTPSVWGYNGRVSLVISKKPYEGNWREPKRAGLSAGLHFSVERPF